jgi:hypothetical protein
MSGWIDVISPQLTSNCSPQKAWKRQEAIIIVVAVEGSAHVHVVHPVLRLPRGAGARCEAAWRPYSSPFFARAYAHTSTSQGFAQTPPAITAQSLMPPDIPTKPQTNRICMQQAPTLASLPQLGKSSDFRLNVKLQIADTSIDQPQPQTIVSAPGLPA